MAHVIKEVHRTDNLVITHCDETADKKNLIQTDCLKAKHLFFFAYLLFIVIQLYFVIASK